MSILKNTLQTNNAHIRDKNIQFYEPTHTYTIIPDAKSKYKSVTTWNHSHFPHFDADDIIKKMIDRPRFYDLFSCIFFRINTIV